MPQTLDDIRQGLVVYAKDKTRVSAFYRGTLGIALVESASTHDVLRGSGVEVVVHAIPPAYAAGIRIGVPPEIREDTPLKPVFMVADLDAVRAAASVTGGALKPLDQAWRYDGAVVLDGNDPEGNVVQFRQRE